MLEKVSQEELQEALKNPEPFFKKFLAEAGGMIVVKLLLPKLKREFEPLLQQTGLTWEDVQPAFELVDSRAELEEATSNPQEFFKKLLKQDAPVVKKIQQKMKEAQAQAEDMLEDAGVDPGLVNMWLGIFKPILVSNIKDLGKQYKHHPELCNEGMGEKLLKEC